MTEVTTSCMNMDSTIGWSKESHTYFHPHSEHPHRDTTNEDNLSLIF